MEIIKVAHLSEEEVEKLKSAGELLGTIARGLESGEIHDLSEADLNLIEALKAVLGKIVFEK